MGGVLRVPSARRLDTPKTLSSRLAEVTLLSGLGCNGYDALLAKEHLSPLPINQGCQHELA
jgi:hypothetical protein